MHKNLKWLLSALVLTSSLTPLAAQTTPVSLPFSLTSQSSATLPTGVALHRFGTIPTARVFTSSTVDLPAVSNVPSGTTGGWYYLGSDGIGILTTATVAAGDLTVAINTTGLTNINVSWICKTILNQASRNNSVALQYRVGSSGNFINVGTTTTYTSNGKANGDVSSIFTETLPVGAENQPLVQVRWIYWESTSTSGDRDKIAVDDISISAATNTCNAPVVTASGVDDSSATFTWNSVATAATYEYVLDNVAAAPTGSGTAITDTTYHASGLNYGTTYYFHVRTNCSGGDNSPWVTTPITTTTPPCDLPVPVASGVTDSTATFTWNTNSTAVTFEYVLNNSAADPASGTVTTDTVYHASGLASGTPYYFHVRSNCAAGNSSAWVTDSIVTTGIAPAFTLMTYNLLNYPASTASTREPFYRTIMAAAQPDILVVQELSSASGINNFLNNVLNFSGGSTYSAGTFIDGPDTDNGLFYKSARFQFISNTAITTSLRNISQFKLREISSGDTLIVYSVHLKADNTAPDAAQRGTEAATLRGVTDALPTGQNFVVCGDFNIYGSTEAAYQNLIQTGSNVNGKFNDVLSMSGTWNNSFYAPYHTQSPRTTSFGGGATGGMDDRFDMILFSNKIIGSGGFDIVSNTYKAFGNDGQHYNQALNTPPYTVYDSVLCAALHGASDHIPVVVKLQHSTSPIAAPFKMPKDLSINGFLSVYPNPAHDQLYIRINQDYKLPATLQLFNINGSLLRSVPLREGKAGEMIGIDLSTLPGGVYYLRSAENSGAYKVVKY